MKLRYTSPFFIPIFISILILTAAPALSAHPHMWLTGTIEPVVRRNLIDSVRITWVLDDYTSASLILSYDEDRDGSFSRRESETLRDDAFLHLFDSGYFTAAQIQNRPIAIPRARNFSAKADDGTVTYTFTLPINARLRSDEAFEVYFFDPSFFIAFKTIYSPPSEGTGTIRFTTYEKSLPTQGWGDVIVEALQGSLK